jgi:hypothetical protein
MIRGAKIDLDVWSLTREARYDDEIIKDQKD